MQAEGRRRIDVAQLRATTFFAARPIDAAQFCSGWLCQKHRMESDRHSQPPACPSCGRLMRFARAVPEIGAQPELWTYECRQCGVMLTAAWEPRGRRDTSKTFW